MATAEDVRAAELRAQISALFDEKQHVIDAARREEKAAASALDAAARREASAVELAASRVDAIAKSKAAPFLTSKPSGSLKSNQQAVAQLRSELRVLSSEEEVRNKRIADMEVEIKAIQSRIAKQANQYSEVLMQISDVKLQFAEREVGSTQSSLFQG